MVGSLFFSFCFCFFGVFIMADEKHQILVNDGWKPTSRALNSLTKTLNFTLESSKKEGAFDGILLIARSLATLNPRTKRVWMSLRNSFEMLMELKESVFLFGWMMET